MAPIACPTPNCEYTFQEGLNADQLRVLLEFHTKTAHPTPTAPAPNTNKTKAEKVRRPTITIGGTSEDWSYFMNRWTEYKAATQIAADDAVYQLLETCHDDLRKDLNRTYGSLIDEDEDIILQYMKTLAIRPENIMVARVQLQNLRQQRDEPIRSFVARLRGQASVCNFISTKRCQCTANVTIDYSEDMVRDALIRGLEDSDIQLHILGQANQDLTLQEAIQLAEAQECGKRSAGPLSLQTNGQTMINATSSYKHKNNQRNHPSQPTRGRNNQRNSYQQQPARALTQSRQTTPKQQTCSHCGQDSHGNNNDYQTRLKKCLAFNHRCTKCQYLHHYESLCRSQPKNSSTAASADDTAGFFTDADTASALIEQSSFNCDKF